jgi:Ni,Fe-hydrogenase III large subunit/Ni,Fe-hydrogenase III component G
MVCITIHPSEFKAKILQCYGGGRNVLSAMFANDERSISGGFAIYCIFLGRDEQQIMSIKTLLEDEQFPSLTPDIPAAAWYEREIYDLFGLLPVGHPDLRPLVNHENWPQGLYPLRKDFDAVVIPEANEPYPLPQVGGEGIFEVPVGPIHAGIIEPGHFRFSQAGENVINLEAKLFFTHRGIEKSVEDLRFEDAFYNVERVCGACSVSHALSYCQALEALAGVEIPRRAGYLRVLTAEMERLYNHIGDIGNICAGLGFAPGISHGGRLKEKLMRLNEIVTGNRFLRGMVIPGGVRMDITRSIAQEIETVIRPLMKDFSEMLELLSGNDAFLNRVNTTGILPRQAALDLGIVGIAARASGVDADMRRDYPYAIYNELDLKVPVYSSGDVAARIWVRADEAVQSISLIQQVLAGLPYGPLKVDTGAIKPFSSALGWSESPRGGNLHWVMAGKDNTVYRCFIRSASYPNWPAVALAAPGNIIPDFPLINKSFELCYACLDR